MKRNKSWLIVIGSLIILMGIGLIGFYYYSKKIINIEEKQAIEEFYEEDNEEIITEEPEEIEEVKEQEKIEYIAILKIPKINLERGLVDPNSYLNNVNYNIEWLDESAMPDKEGGNVIIAGHTGTSSVSFFRNLDKLVIGDDISIIYKDKTYNYKIVDIYDIEKTGTAKIIRNKNKSTLTLITCRHKTNKQIVIISELIGKV